MGLYDLTQNVLDRALSGAALRQSVLANNIANANTPGFKRSDVDFQDALAQALDGSTPVDSVQFAVREDTTSAARADGNNVDMDAETANLTENAVDYQALVAVAHTRLSELQTVLGGH